MRLSERRARGYDHSNSGSNPLRNPGYFTVLLLIEIEEHLAEADASKLSEWRSTLSSGLERLEAQRARVSDARACGNLKPSDPKVFVAWERIVGPFMEYISELIKKIDARHALLIREDWQ